MKFRRRVLHLIASNFIGGPERQILRHAIEDQSDEVELWVGSFRDGKETAEILARAADSGLSTIEIGSKSLPYAAVVNIAQLCKQHEISLLCTHGYKANVLGFAASKITGLPQVAFVRGWTGENLKVRFYDFLERLVLRWADRVVCVSRVQALQVGRTRWRARAPIVIPNATTFSVPESGDKRQLRSSLGLAPESFVVLAAGRLSPEKGHGFLLEAAAQLKPSIERLQVVILGAGHELQRLEQQCKELELENRVTFPGFQKNISDWLQASDVLVNPSLSEGMPNVVLEGMAAGATIVATEVGAVPDMIEDGVSGLIVRAASAEQIRDAVYKLAKDISLAERIGKAAKERSKLFCPQSQREALAALYAETFGREPSRSQGLSPGAWPKLSIVVPVWNEAEAIGRVLRQLLEQEYPTDLYEIIVADGGSTDSTRDIVREMGGAAKVPIRLVDNPGRLSSAGRNVGIKNSTGEIIIFVDGHCIIPSRQLLANTASIMMETGAACLARPQPLCAPHNTFMQRLIAAVRGTVLGHGTDSTIYSTGKKGFVNPTSSGAVYRREVFEKIGMYDEGFDACEDVELNFRVHQSGLSSFIDPRLSVLYEPRKSLPALFRQMIRYGRGRFKLLLKHPSSWSLGQLVPASLSLFAVATALSVLLLGRIPSTFSLGWILYFALVFLSSAELAFKKDFRFLFVAPLAYFAIHFGLGYGFLREAFASIGHGTKRT